MITQPSTHALSELAQAIAGGPLAALPVGLALLDQDLRYLAVNEALAAVNGVSVEDHLGRTVAEVLPEVDPGAILHLRDVLETGRSFRGGELCFPVPAAPGEPRWWVENYEAVRDADGGVVGVLATVTEISDRKRAEEAERRASAFLRQALARLPVGVVIVDAEGAEVYQNSVVGDILRADQAGGSVAPYPEWPLFRRTGELYPLEDRALARSLRAAETVAGEEVRVDRRDGSEAWISVSTAPVDDDDGRRLGAVAVIEDITGRRSADGAREAFLGVLAHEMRSPLTVILGNAELLVRRPDMSPDGRLETAEDIAAEASRLARTVEDLLVLSRVDRGVDLRRHDPVHVMRTVRRVVGDEERRWPGQQFAVEAGADLPLAAGDETYVAHVLTNLLSNAAKYGGGGPVRIRVNAPDGRLCVRVLDEGPGFAPGDEQRVFELFYRSPRTARKATGAGVGLFVVRALVQAQGGSVWATTTDDAGAEVGFSLPLYDPDG